MTDPSGAVQGEPQVPPKFWFVHRADGDDRNPGTKEAPLRTMAEVLRRIREQPPTSCVVYPLADGMEVSAPGGLPCNLTIDGSQASRMVFIGAIAIGGAP